MTMLWGDKRFNSVNYFLKQKFGEKIFKIPLDAGFTCPNRDGKISRGGCIFCSEMGSGDFTGESKDLVKQFHQGKEIMTRKWKSDKYMAYFQAYTNTYADVLELRDKYYSVINLEGVCGIAIATRPDCLSNEVLELLHEISQKTYLWVELGLQTSNDKTAELINRGYQTNAYLSAIKNLGIMGIEVVTHVIFGLPGESIQDMLNTIDFVAGTKTWGIKFHLLHLMKNTKMVELYISGKLRFLEQDEYIDLIVDSLERIPGSMVIHRLTGDSPRELLIGPIWSLKKWEVLNGIDKRLLERSTWQGKLYREILVEG